MPSRLRPMSAVAPQSMRKRGLGRLDVIAGLQPAARAERVAATDNRQFHGIRFACDGLPQA